MPSGTAKGTPERLPTASSASKKRMSLGTEPESKSRAAPADGFVTAEGKYGYLVVDPVTGKYTYTLYNGENGKPGTVQNLAEGQMEKEEFNVMLNGTRQTPRSPSPSTVPTTHRSSTATRI